MQSEELLESYSPEAVSNLQKWPADLHDEQSDIMMDNQVTEHVGTVQYRSQYRDMIMKHLTENMF